MSWKPSKLTQEQIIKCKAKGLTTGPYPRNIWSYMKVYEQKFVKELKEGMHPDHLAKYNVTTVKDSKLTQDQIDACIREDFPFGAYNSKDWFELIGYQKDYITERSHGKHISREVAKEELERHLHGGKPYTRDDWN